MKKTISEILKSLNACDEGCEWAGKYTNRSDAWAECPRGDWMLWLLGSLSGPPGSASRKKLALCACECARLSLRYVPATETRPLAAIETAEQWAGGESGITIDMVHAAASAAYAAYAAYAAFAAFAAASAAASVDAADAADAADAVDAAYAADAVAYAAYAAAFAADAVDAADAADAAASAFAAAYAAAADAAAADAVDAAYAVAKLSVLKECADIVRKHYPKPPRIARLRAVEERT